MHTRCESLGQRSVGIVLCCGQHTALVHLRMSITPLWYSTVILPANPDSSAIAAILDHSKQTAERVPPDVVVRVPAIWDIASRGTLTPSHHVWRDTFCGLLAMGYNAINGGGAKSRMMCSLKLGEGFRVLGKTGSGLVSGAVLSAMQRR